MLALALVTPAAALPLLGSRTDIGNVSVYPDSERDSVFYYAPGPLSICMDKDGKPEITFLQMRYMGTGATGDRGEFRTLSTLSFRVAMQQIDKQSLSAARTALRGREKVYVTLKPLPIRRVEATLNYTPLSSSDTPAEEAQPRPVGECALQEDEKTSAGTGYWSERVFSVFPDDATSQALWDSLEAGRVILSLSYAFYSDGIPPESEKPKIEGNIELPETEPAETDEEPEPDPRVVIADTLAVTVDASQLPEKFKKIDINESIPPGYAVLSVYCYDFADELHPNLFLKTVEIRAVSVTGKPVVREVTFSKSSPEIYSASVRFPFAISMKEPYRYRIRQVDNSGRDTTSPWMDGKPWSQMLDVTTPREEQPDTAEETSSGGTE